MKLAMRERQELDDGYAIRLAADPAVVRAAAEWIARERRCCPFLTLGLDWSSSGAVWLRLAAGPGIKRFLGERLARN